VIGEKRGQKGVHVIFGEYNINTYKNIEFIVPKSFLMMHFTSEVSSLHVNLQRGADFLCGLKSECEQHEQHKNFRILESHPYPISNNIATRSGE
jgi:hypothetical protein